MVRFVIIRSYVQWHVNAFQLLFACACVCALFFLLLFFSSILRIINAPRRFHSEMNR